MEPYELCIREPAMVPVTRSLRMLGKRVRLILDDSTAGQLLDRELDLYPSAESDVSPQLQICYGAFDVPNAGFVNPATHHEFGDGFSAHFGGTAVRWVFNGGILERIDFHVRPSRVTGLRLSAQRMRSNQFTLPDEAVGQVFHELVLIPSVYFESRQFLLHSAGLQAPDGTVTLIGGTGGVGKTSLGLELCRHHGFRFVTDDIAVVDETGHVWPNLAFPKVYGYNVDGDSELQALVLRRGSWADQMNWRLHRRRGADRVRRRVSPADLYSAYSKDGGRLARYIFIARELRDDIVIESAPAAVMASLSTMIMDAEYHAFHNHLTWHAMNRLLCREPPLVVRDAVLERWQALAATVLKRVDCLLVRVPRAMNHGRFKSELVTLITGDKSRV